MRELIHINRLVSLMLVVAAVGCGKSSQAANDMAAAVPQCSGSALWTPQPLGSFGRLYQSVWGSSATDVYVVGSATVRHSVDGGQTWATLDVPTSSVLDFETVWGTSTASVYLGGGSVWRSTDGGASWMKLQWPVLTVWGLSDNDLFGATGSGLDHSSDAGATWSQSFDGNVLSVWGTGPSDLYLSSDYGAVFHSNDDGATWQMVLPGMSSGGTAFGGGEGAVYTIGNKILRTSDDGASWVDLGAPSFNGNLNLSAVWVGADGNEVFAVGQISNTVPAVGVVLHSADRGASWSVDLQCMDNEVLTAVWGSSPTDVYAVGAVDFALHRN